MNIKKIAQFAIGPLGAAALGFITLPITVWYFTPEDIGRISMLQVMISFCVLLFSLGLDQAYVREFHEVDDTPALFKFALLPGLSLLFLISIVFLIFPTLISSLLFEVKSAVLSWLVLVCIISSFVSRFLSLILRMQEKGLAYSMSQVLPKLLFLVIIGFYILFYPRFNLMELVLANTLSIVLVLIILTINTYKEWLMAFTCQINFNKVREMLIFGMPLILGSVAFWGLTAMDKIFLKKYSTYTELGIYSVAVSFASAATILQSIFSTVWAPIVYKWVRDNENIEKVNKVTEYILLAVIFMFSAAGMLSWILDYILPKQYSAVKYIVVSCLGAPLLYTLSETTVIGISVMRKTGYAMLAALVALGVNLFCNYQFIPHYGAIGAAISTSIAFFVFFILRTEFSIRVWKPLPRLKLYVWTTLVVSLAVFTSLSQGKFSFYLNGIWILIFTFVVRAILKARKAYNVH